MASLSTGLRTSRLAAIKTANDLGGANSGLLHIYSGAVPSDVGTAANSSNLLVSMTGLTINTTAGTSATVTVTATNAVANGTPTFARLTNTGNVAYMQVTAGTAGGEELHVDQAIALGGRVTLTSGSIPEGNA